jgi:hypothetical protein
MLESGDSEDFSRCLLMSELGAIALVNKDAEKKLSQFLLTETGNNEKCAAYGYLSFMENPNPVTLDAIKKFKADPRNVEVVEHADEINSAFCTILLN